MHSPYLINFLCLAIINLIGCTNPPAEKGLSTNLIGTLHSTPQVPPANSAYYIEQDTITIKTEIGQTLVYTKEEFNRIVDEHPEFFQVYPDHPDLSYFVCQDKEGFDDESGKDTYYALYAFFLKQRNGEARFAQERQQLIAIYSAINDLFAVFERGGSFFAHQKMRILGHAEYSVYILQKNTIRKTYSISKQKALYLQTIRQQISDEISAWLDMSGSVKAGRIKELNQRVDELDLMITDNFYLRRAQEFHYTHYEYW